MPANDRATILHGRPRLAPYRSHSKLLYQMDKIDAVSVARRLAGNENQEVAIEVL
jgi:hypothetical protein